MLYVMVLLCCNCSSVSVPILLPRHARPMLVVPRQKHAIHEMMSACRKRAGPYAGRAGGPAGSSAEGGGSAHAGAAAGGGFEGSAFAPPPPLHVGAHGAPPPRSICRPAFLTSPSISAATCPNVPCGRRPAAASLS